MAIEQNRKVIINDLLCYAVNKFGGLGNRPLKSTIVDFYKSEVISAAKDSLVEQLDTVDMKSVKIPRRRKDSIGRSASEVDDILSIITHLDEEKKLESLPIYVSSNPDNMPTVKLTDGDLACVLLKLSKLESEMTAIRSAVSQSVAVSQQILSQKSSAPVLVKRRSAVLHLSTAERGAPGVVNNETGVIKPRLGGALLQGQGHSDSQASDSATGQGATDGGVTGAASSFSDDEDDWQLQTSRKNKQLPRKRHRPSLSPKDSGEMPTYASTVQSNATSAAATAAAARKQPRTRNTVFGVSAAGTAVIKPSANLQVPKSVFKIGNVDGLCSPAELQCYLQSINVSVFTCFELPRTARQPLENKSFRVCILAGDKAKLLNDQNWSLGITIRPWVFKEKKLNIGAGGISAQNNNHAVKPHDGNDTRGNNVTNRSLGSENTVKECIGMALNASKSPSVPVNSIICLENDDNTDMLL